MHQELTDYDLSHIGKSAAVYTRLKHFLTAGHLRAGERLQPSELASLLHVSVTPVREALLRLSLEGFVRAVMNKGYFTKPYEWEEQKNLYEILLTLLSCAIEKNPGRFSAAGLSQPMDANGELYAQFVENLLLRVAALSENPEVLNVVGLILERTHVTRIVDLEEARSLRMVIADMSEFIEAMAVGDVSRAQANLGTQFQKLFQRLPELVRCANDRVATAILPR